MNPTISKKLKDLRKKRGLSQKELSDGICAQAVISNIENDEVIPSSIILYKISQKLGVDINYFFNGKITDTPGNEFNEIKTLVRSLVKKNEYNSIYYIVSNELDKISKEYHEEWQFLNWHKGLCEYYVNRNIEEALNILSLCLDFNKINFTPQEISILNSMAVIYFEEKDYLKSHEIYERCFESLKLTQKNELELELEIRILYGYARVLVSLNKIEESLYLFKSAIQKCIDRETLYLLGEIHFQIGRTLLLINKNSEALTFLSKAKMLFEIQNNIDYVNISEKTISLANG